MLVEMHEKAYNSKLCEVRSAFTHLETLAILQGINSEPANVLPNVPSIHFRRTATVWQQFERETFQPSPVLELDETTARP